MLLPTLSLSLRSHSDAVLAISSIEPEWLKILVDGYSNDPATHQMWTELSLHATNDKEFSLEQGVIRF
jgi:hypothetical protein